MTPPRSDLGWILLLSLLACPILTPGNGAQAQTLPVSLELRGGMSLPYGDLRNTSRASTGLAGTATLHVDVTSRVAAYAGGGYHSFVCDRVRCGGEMNTRGGEAGLRLTFPGTAAAHPWVRAGAILHKGRWAAAVSVGDVEPDPTLDPELETDWEPGFEIGAGADFPFRSWGTLTLGVRQYRYSGQFVRSVRPTLDRTFSYIVLDAGIRFTP